MKSYKGGGCCEIVFGIWSKRDRFIEGNEFFLNEIYIDFSKEGR